MRSSTTPRAPSTRTRGLLVWTAASTLAVAGAWAGGAAVVRVATTWSSGRTADFAGIVTDLAAVAAAVAGAALWWTATVVLREAWGGPGHPGHGGHDRVGPVHRLLLGACGIGVATTLTISPALAVEPAPAAPSVAGLPLPDRATGTTAPAVRVDAGDSLTPGRGGEAVVGAGDSLWSIADAALGPEAGTARVAAYWRRLVEANRSAVGGQPDLIHPGLRLRLPVRPSPPTPAAPVDRPTTQEER